MFNVEGGRKIIDNRVQKHLNALVFIGRTAEHGSALHAYGSFAQTPSDFFGGKFHRFEELFHKLVVAFRGGFHNSHMRFFGFVRHICGDFRLMILLAVLGIVYFRVHFDEVDYTLEGVFLADGQFDGNGVRVEPVPHHLHGARKVCAVDVHFIDVCDTGNLILVRLTPDRFRLGFDAALRAESRDGSVEYAERTLYFYGEVHVSRGIYDVDSAFVLFG